jgi:hypothetical protein
MERRKYMKRWKVGTLSAGLALIGFGVLLLIGRIQNISSIELVYKWWPVVLIMLGIETLVFVYFAKNEEKRVRFDGVSITLIVVIVLFTIGGYGFRAVFNNSFLRFNGNNIITNYQYESKFNKNMNVTTDGLKKIKISNAFGKINVSKASGQDIEIHADITIGNNNENQAKTFSEKAIEISKDSSIKISTSDFKADDIKSIRVDYIIKVPEGIEVEVDNSFGDISVREISSNVDIENSNGKITAGAIEGNAVIKNSFGAIEVTDVKGNVNIKNSNGLTAVKNAGGNVDVKNSFGDIEIQIAGGNVRAESSNGRIYVEAPAGTVYAHNSFGEIFVKEASKAMTLESSNGLIRVETSKLLECDVAVKNSFGGIKLDILRSQAARVKASTSFGNIQNNIDLNVIKETTKASVDQTVGDGKLVFDLKTSNGNIEINGK